jgi:hypothetical protein
VFIDLGIGPGRCRAAKSKISCGKASCCSFPCLSVGVLETFAEVGWSVGTDLFSGVPSFGVAWRGVAWRAVSLPWAGRKQL